MKILALILVIIGSTFKAQVIKDTIFGKPKFVKEYVLFLNESGPFTFMRGDSEYGHAVMMIPKFLRSNMSRSWFSTNFCRYTNNETKYDHDGRMTKETWFYRSGRFINAVDYKYDDLSRLKTVVENDKYSTDKKTYIYQGNSNKIHFIEDYKKLTKYGIEAFKDMSDWDEERLIIKNVANNEIPYESRFYAKTKTDSIFEITNKKYIPLENNSFTRIQDSVFYRKLKRLKIYNDEYKVIEEKIFNFEDDLYNLKTTLTDHRKYEYDEKGRVLKQINFNDGNNYSYIINAAGKVLSEEKTQSFGKTYFTTFKYDDKGKILEKTHNYDNRISHQEKYEYEGNYIKKLTYSEFFGIDGKELRTSIITFKYKFDKQKNWTECIKNVDGKDLYLWKREIQYYK
jgi:hypothetical protein